MESLFSQMLAALELMPIWFIPTAAGSLAAVLASFFTVAGERGAHGETLQGRSRCACGRQLKVIENIPIFGYLAAGGMARCCQTKIPPHYLLAETLAFIFTAAAFLLSAGLGLTTLVGCQLFAWALARHHAQTRTRGEKGRK